MAPQNICPCPNPGICDYYLMVKGVIKLKILGRGTFPELAG